MYILKNAPSSEFIIFRGQRIVNNARRIMLWPSL